MRSLLSRRARTRAALPVGGDWVSPYWLERQLDPSSPAFVPTDGEPTNVTARRWTPVGTIGGRGRAVVDPRGLVTPRPGGWSLDWWIGADDRWHLPSREVAVRQRLIDDTPVVETAMRVPGGDAVQRVYGAVHADGDLVVVEIENRSSLPFAVALAVRPYNVEALAVVERVELRDDTTVAVDGAVAMLLPKRPSRLAGATFADGDVASIVMSGGATESFPAALVDDAGRATAAFVFPLAHTATLRVALPIDRGAARVMPGLPSAQQVANGWAAHASRGMRVELPDARLMAAVAANRAFALLQHDDDAASLEALDRFGYQREVGEVLASWPEGGLGDGGAVHAIAGHWRLHRDRDLVTRLAPWMAASAERLARARHDDARAALLDAAGVLGAIGERVAAEDAGRLAASLSSVPTPERDLARLESLLDDAPSPAELLLVVRGVLVRETDDGLALLSRVPDTWLGQGVEVHDAPTHHGSLSFAVRWHGDRPALLWELVPHDDRGDVRITVPGLDPSWSSRELAGESLLAPVAVPGQVSAVSLRRRS